MYIYIKELRNVEFPVYVLPSSEWYTEDGLLFLDGQVVDDKNVDQPTLGKRRLITPFSDRLLRLKRIIWNVEDMLHCNSNIFIDTLGRPFIYIKTIRADLKYHKIKAVKVKDTYTLLFAQGCVKPFKIPRPPLPGIEWVGIIHYHGFPWIIYEYSYDKKKDTWRKI